MKKAEARSCLAAARRKCLIAKYHLNCLMEYLKEFPDSDPRWPGMPRLSFLGAYSVMQSRQVRILLGYSSMESLFNSIRRSAQRGPRRMGMPKTAARR